MTAHCLAYLVVLVGFAPLPGRAVSGDKLKQEQISKTGRVPRDGIQPKEGFVPDETTAIGIAKVVLAEVDLSKRTGAVLRVIHGK